MTIIQLDSAGSTTLFSLTTVLADKNMDESEKNTTVALLLTSLTTSSCKVESKPLYYASQYIDSLSEVQLMEMEEKLEEKEQQMMVSFEEPKVYQKTEQC